MGCLHSVPKRQADADSPSSPNRLPTVSSTTATGNSPAGEGHGAPTADVHLPATGPRPGLEPQEARQEDSRQTEPRDQSAVGPSGSDQPSDPATPAHGEPGEGNHANTGGEISPAGQDPEPEAAEVASCPSAPAGALTPADPARGHGDLRKLVLIVWDIENVRLPKNPRNLDELKPSAIVRYIKQHFIVDPGRIEYRMIAAVTAASLDQIQRLHSDFLDEMVPDVTLLMASHRKKYNADIVLKKELSTFVREYGGLAMREPRQHTVVVISGDGDFLEPVMGAMASGFNVELMVHSSAASKLVQQPYYGAEAVAWLPFLEQMSGVPARQIELPYPPDNGRNNLPPLSFRRNQVVPLPSGGRTRRT